jgi:hypothetical protein
MSVQKSKGLRLTKDDREAVRDAIREPLYAQIDAQGEAARKELAAKAYDEIYTAEQQKAIKTLFKDHADARSSMYVYGPEREGRSRDYTYIKFFGQLFVSSGRDLYVSQETIDEHRRIKGEFGTGDSTHYKGVGYVIDRGAAQEPINKIVAELNSVLLSAKTRAQLGEIWPAVYDLMGKEWVDAVEEPNTLPALLTDNLNAVVAQLKAA